MRYFYYLLAVLMMTATHAKASDVGISISIGQPGFYGELHFGGYYPTPQLIYPQPILIWQTPANLWQPPIYMHVPPGHAKNWSHYCYTYNACNRNVYFVQENWYRNVYIPYYQKRSSYWDRHNDRYSAPQHYPPRSYHDNVRGGQDYRDKHDQQRYKQPYDSHPGSQRDKDRRDYDNYRNKHDDHPGKGKRDKDYRKD